MRLDNLYKLKDWILKKTTIDKTLVFNGNKKELVDLLLKTQDLQRELKFYLDSIDENNFTIVSSYSVGTMLINYMPTKGFELKGTIQPLDTERLEVRLTSKIRFEIYLMMIISIVSLTILLIKIRQITIWLLIVPFILVPWFNWIYMIQSEGLLEKIKKYLRLK